MTDCPISGRGQGHVSNFYIVDLENFATASRRCTGVINELFDDQLVDYICDSRAREVIRSYALFDCNPLSPSFTSISSGLVVEVLPTLLCSIWQEFG